MSILLKPEFYDIFGLLTFSFLTIIAILGLKKISLPKWVFFVLLIIGIAGLLIDGLIVYASFLK